MKLWRVTIQLKRRSGERNVRYCLYAVMAADPEGAKILALTEWGQPWRDDTVDRVTAEAEDTGIISCGIVTAKEARQ